MSEQLVGSVTHFFGKAGVIALEMTQGELKVGDTIHVTGHLTDFTESRRLHADRARPGDRGEARRPGRHQGGGQGPARRRRLPGAARLRPIPAGNVTMEYREHRGLTLSEVGVGGYALAGAYGAVDRAEFIALLRRAHALGVTVFDTAGNYGDAEAVLGEAVRPFRDEVILATKVGSPEGAPPRLTPEAVRAACARSLERLGTDRIDLLQVHFDDPATPVEDTVAALEGLRDQGLIRHYGVGHLPAHRVARYVEVGDPFSILMELSAVARDSRRTLLPLCGGQGPAAIGFSVTGRGLLTGAIGPETTFEEGDIRRFDPLFQRARFASGRRVAEHLGALARSLGRTPAQVAIAWVLSQPGVACALTGPRRLAHLEENLGGSGRRLPAEALAGLEALFAREDAGAGGRGGGHRRHHPGRPAAAGPRRRLPRPGLRDRDGGGPGPGRRGRHPPGVLRPLAAAGAPRGRRPGAGAGPGRAAGPDPAGPAVSHRRLRERLGDARMRAVLASPWHRRHSHNTLVLEVTGRRSGRRYRLPVSYVEDAGALLVFVDEAERQAVVAQPARRSAGAGPAPRPLGGEAGRGGLGGRPAAPGRGPGPLCRRLARLHRPGAASGGALLAEGSAAGGPRLRRDHHDPCRPPSRSRSPRRASTSAPVTARQVLPAPTEEQPSAVSRRVTAGSPTVIRRMRP